MKAYIVDRAALAANAAAVCKAAGDVPVWGVLKGDGYGLGAVEMARVLRENGIGRFAVTEPSEAAALRDAGFTEEPILMLRSTADPDELNQLMDCNVIAAVGSMEAAVALHTAAEQRSAVAPAHIEIDTGMGRSGFSPDELEKVLAVFGLSAVSVCGMFTHFHSAFSDKKQTLGQYDRFQSMVQQVRDAGFDPGEIHCCNSSAFYKFPQCRADGVRIGSALLGRLPFRLPKGLTTIGWAEATIDELRWLPAGATCGYGAAWTARRPTRMALVSVGYWHGFGAEKGRDIFRGRDCLRGILSNVKGLFRRRYIWVTVHDRRCRVMGHIGMVHTCIDVTDVPCAPGDTVRLEINPLLVKGLDILYR